MLQEKRKKINIITYLSIVLFIMGSAFSANAQIEVSPDELEWIWEVGNSGADVYIGDDSYGEIDRNSPSTGGLLRRNIPAECVPLCKQDYRPCAREYRHNHASTWDRGLDDCPKDGSSPVIDETGCSPC